MRPGLWIGALAALALVAGLVVAARHWRMGATSARPPELSASSPVEADTADEGVVQRALGQAGAEDDEGRWVDEVSGVDAGDLDAASREIFVRHANARHCTCGCGYTLAGCRAYDPTCDKSLPRVIALLDSVRRGWITDAAGLREPPAREMGVAAEGR